MSAPTKERSDARAEPAEPMVHVAFDATPRVALCGARLRGIPADDRAIDCVVCAEIEAAYCDDEWDPA